MSLESDLHRAERANVFISVVSMSALFIYNIILAVFLLLIPGRYRRKKDIEGQKVLITGAGNGLGRRLAIQFSQQSTCLLLLDINKKALLETSQLLHPGARAHTYQCDVTKRDRVYAVAEQIKNDVGEVDILVNNAGIVCGKSFIDLPDESIQKTLEVNALSHFWMCKAFIPSMMARNSGHLVTVASVAGRMGIAKLADYCASKYAAIGFAESIEVEMRAKNLDGIKVTIVCPFVIDTQLFHGVRSTMCTTVSVENAAEKIVEGVLMEEETIYIPGYFKYLTMLQSIAPRWMYHVCLESTGHMNVMDTFVGRTNTRNR